VDEVSGGTKPTKSEQLQATDEITEVAPGILRTQLPANITGLGHVNMYVMEDERGVSVVDPGMPTKSSWVALQERLAQIGVPLRRVHTVIVTHSHPDHYGGAERIKAESGADIVTHRLFRTFYDPTEPPDLSVEDAATFMRSPFDPPPWGGEPMRMEFGRRMKFRVARRFPSLLRVPTPTVRIGDVERVTLAGREWVPVHTPGHTADHLCLFDPESGTLLSGDHVLPTITPHISGLTAHGDPLTLFFDSLDKIAAFSSDVRISLPAHGTPFTNTGERVEQIKQHHRDRLDKIRKVSIDFDRPATVNEFAQHLFSPRAQGSMADSEAYAHLEHLRILGDFEQRDVDGVYEYVIRN
jgi:glyoxylase-like metal-dependent hydrolase (beta-lactamase superfamily II)